MTSTDTQEALDEAMFALSARLKLSGFLDDGANHAAYERVVAVWTNRRTPPTPAADANPFVGTNWQVRADTPTPATEEREAVALAMLNGKRLREGWPITASIPEGFADGDEWRLEAQDALSALAPIRAAEILAAEANERARIVAWLRATSTGLDLTNRRIADAIERNEHGAGK